MKISHSQIARIIGTACVFVGITIGNVGNSFAQSSQEWTEPVNISRSGDSASPVSVVSSDGVIHTLWFDVFEEVYRYSKSEDGGGTWTSPVKGNFPFSLRGDPVRLVAGSDGIVHIFWIDGLNLRYSRATSDALGIPANWGNTRILARYIVNFDVDLTPRGNLHLAYITSLNPEGISYQYSSDGTSWLPAHVVFESSYLRTTSLKDSRIRVVASDDPENPKVYVGWDVRSQKRIYLTSSSDAGVSWAEIEQVKGPEDTGGFGIPFGAEMGIFEKSVLFLWQVGEPGAGQCSLYAQWLRDGSSDWETPELIMGSQSVCPEQVRLIMFKPSVPIILLTYPGNSPALLAWNGTAWSEPQIQEEISLFSDPLTFETIMLGCFQDIITRDLLLLIGCDLGKGGDIWFTSRSLASWEGWFSPSTIWSPPTSIVNSSREISSLAFTSDKEIVHAVWAESPVTDISLSGSAIVYARWDGKNWSTPQKIQSNLSGYPSQLSIATSNQGRLELSWIDEETGDMLYSWANSDRAVNAAEWASPLVLPSPSQWNGAPDVFVDSAGRIGIVYAVPVNENRGIYMTLSEDKGLTWSSPLRVFDAESAGWQMVGNPEVTLSDDGRLHALFTRYATMQEKPVELYYLQSADSGVTWSEPLKVGDGEIMWSEIISYEGNIIHRFWQEEKNSEFANLSQISRDGGVTWENSIDITSVSDSSSVVGLIFDGVQELHFIRLEQDDSLQGTGQIKLIVHDSRWDGQAWIKEVFQEFTFRGRDAQFSIAGGLTPNGFINICILARYYDEGGDLVNEILSIDRSLGRSNGNLTPIPAEISHPEISVAQTLVPTIVADVPTQLTQLSALEDDSSPVIRNILGLVVFLIALGVMIFVFSSLAFRKK